MGSITRAIALGSLVALVPMGCSDTLTDPATDGVEEVATMSSSQPRGPIIHRASVGGPDGCGNSPGCDANFSLIANQYADGMVKGQYHDQFSGGEGTHVTVDCLHVTGKRAVVGGMVTGGEGLGTRAFTIVVDNGRSANDPPDQISLTFHGRAETETCETFVPPQNIFFSLEKGQVRVW